MQRSSTYRDSDSDRSDDGSEVSNISEDESLEEDFKYIQRETEKLVLRIKNITKKQEFIFHLIDKDSDIDDIEEMEQALDYEIRDIIKSITYIPQQIKDIYQPNQDEDEEDEMIRHEKDYAKKLANRIKQIPKHIRKARYNEILIKNASLGVHRRQAISKKKEDIKELNDEMKDITKAVTEFPNRVKKNIMGASTIII